jgi:hypothetical protein
VGELRDRGSRATKGERERERTKKRRNKGRERDRKVYKRF